MQHGLVSPTTMNRLTRRSALRCSLLAAIVLPRHAQSANLLSSSFQASVPPPFQERPELLVAGAEDGPLAPYAAALVSGLNQQLPPTQPVHVRQSGGSDGVTAANQFEASALPDGRTVLLVSGAAAMAWLRGDPRAQFDVGHWLPVATALVSCLVLARSMPAAGDRLRLAVEGDPTLALPAQLGLYLLGLEAVRLVPVEDAVAAVQRGDADLAYVRGPRTAARMAQARGLVPMFTFGSPDQNNNLLRDPFLPGVSTLPELLESHSGRLIPKALLIGWHATAAAARLEMALLLPWLTPPGSVAWWREACGDISMPQQQDAAHPELGAVGSRLWRNDPNANFGITPIVVDSTTSLALHRWMVDQSV